MSKRIFFGKISASANKEFNDMQIENKRYYADKNSSWFGNITLQDYCYILSGSNIYYWQAEKWASDRKGDYLQFKEIIKGKLPINGNKFRALNIFKFNSDLMVLTIRQVRNKAFFELKLTDNVRFEDIKESNFYLNDLNYRSIEIVDDNFNNFNKKNIYLIKGNDGIKLYKSNFFDGTTYDNFRDNTKYLAAGIKRNKNSTLKKIVDATISQTLDSKSLPLNSFYDSFFVEYDKDLLENENRTEGDISSYKFEQNKQLNKILYGPPGTGKTYNTINKALEIIFDQNKRCNNQIEDIKKTYKVTYKEAGCNSEEKDVTYEEASSRDDRIALKAIFDYFQKQGQIEFVTFHQSYGYEEFVEGIKADLKDENIKYKLEEGVFKRLCNKAKSKSVPSIIVNSTSQVLTKDIFKDLYNNFTSNLIEKDSNQKSNFPMKTKTGVVFDLFKNSSPSIVVKSGEERTSQSISHNELEQVLFEKKKPTYSSYENVIIEKILENFDYTETTIDNTTKNYILIIDEINRGNISKIFGELITLIEPSKRIGENEEIMLKLPNSSTLFGVPSNLYIIGTMNTADRSIAQIDTALRRRFVFEEMMPNSDLFTKNKDEISDDSKYSERKSDLEVKGINVRLMLNAINERIEYIYDREHTIGHSYFMQLLKDGCNTEEKLGEIFRVSIIPLLAEYFYGDWADIKVILNDLN